jgi:hypothetical protein
VQIVEAAEKGNLDVLWAIGYDIMQSHADIVRTQKVIETCRWSSCRTCS